MTGLRGISLDSNDPGFPELEFLFDGMSIFFSGGLNSVRRDGFEWEDGTPLSEAKPMGRRI